MPTMVRLRQASKETGLSYEYLRKACNENAIPHIWSGNRILINLDWLMRYLETQGLKEG